MSEHGEAPSIGYEVEKEAKMKITTMKLSDLKKPEKNVRIHTDCDPKTSAVKTEDRCISGFFAPNQCGWDNTDRDTDSGIGTAVAEYSNDAARWKDNDEQASGLSDIRLDE